MAAPNPEDKKLDAREQRFVEVYCDTFNAAEAAREAGYADSTAYKNASGWTGINGDKPHVARAIQKRLDELSMSAGEGLMRMTQWARGTMAPFMQPGPGGGLVLDLSTEEAEANLHLIRKVKQKERVIKAMAEEGESETVQLVSVEVEIELHDAKDATDKILKAHGAYVERIRHEGEGGGPILIQRVNRPPSEGEA